MPQNDISPSCLQCIPSLSFYWRIDGLGAGGILSKEVLSEFQIHNKWRLDEKFQLGLDINMISCIKISAHRVENLKYAHLKSSHI